MALMQGHSGSAKAKTWHRIISTTKQALSIKLATTVGLFYVTLTLKMFIWLEQLVLSFEQNEHWPVPTGPPVRQEAQLTIRWVLGPHVDIGSAF